MSSVDLKHACHVDGKSGLCGEAESTDGKPKRKCMKVWGKEVLRGVAGDKAGARKQHGGHGTARLPASSWTKRKTVAFALKCLGERCERPGSSALDPSITEG